MENSLIESIFEQAFNFGAFGTSARFKSFKCEDLQPCTDIDLSQDLTCTIIYTNDEGIDISKDVTVRTINETCSYPFKHLAFLSEISIHRRILPHLEKHSSSLVKHNFPHFYYGTVSSTINNDEGVIISERLRNENIRASPRFWDRSHLLVAMELLAKFHANSYSAKSKDSIRFSPEMRRLHEINFSSFGPTCVTPKIANSYLLNGSLQEYIKQNLAKKPEPRSVVCLGITNTAKTLVEYDSTGNAVSIKLMDLFGVRYAPPGFDLMNVLYLCVDQKTRDESWNDALRLYYDTLIENVDQEKDIPLFVEIQKDFKFFSLLAYVTASVTFTKYFADKIVSVEELLEDVENDILSRNLED